MAEMEGFEPPHALRRLADFESAPFSHLGTSPSGPYYISPRGKNQVVLSVFFASAQAAVEGLFFEIEPENQRHVVIRKRDAVQPQHRRFCDSKCSDDEIIRIRFHAAIHRTAGI